ncbi:MAG: DUF4933 domain-containing protein [Salinivirgaceae bacterium]|nr:DUF4933 domain-containing protein [Salinivirgaceae bacterium]
MNRYLKFIFVGIVFVLFSCQNNPLKTNQKLLEKDLLSAESEKGKAEREREAQEKILADSLAKLPKGYRFKEDRSVNLANKPKVIDIAGNLNNVKDIKLSDVASNIEYIRMEPVPDSTFPREMKYKYYLLDDYIVALNYFGIQLYNRQGKFIQTIVKNEFTGVDYNPKTDCLTIRNDHTKIGGGSMVWGYGNKLFYNYTDNINGKKYILEYDCSSTPSFTSKKFDPENPDALTAFGEVAVDLNHGTKQKHEKINSNGAMMAGSGYFYATMETFLLDKSTYLKSFEGGENMLAIFNNRGDTLSTFTMLERLKNYTKNLVRGTDGGDQYENRGKLYFRNAFNDTIFQVVPPNRLVPVYVFNLGEYKVSKQDGLDPDFDLSGKIIPHEWADAKNFGFLTFTKDSYDCPSNRRKKKVEIYYALYSKISGELAIIKGDPYNYSDYILENNIDGGPNVWPASFMIGNDGEILNSIKGADLKDHVKSDRFLNDTVLSEKKDKLKSLAASLSDTDDVLMIVN